MLTHSRGAFRELLEFSWETGARPQELFQLKVAHVKADRIQFSVAESKGKRSKRVIYLTEKAAKIAASLIKGRSKEEFVFLNKLGNPWNKSSVGCQMGRLKKKTGKRFGLYDIRHAFATRMLESGLGHITVAKLMGHKDASMISRVYSHIGEQNDFLLQQLRRVS
jgi:integrase